MAAFSSRMIEHSAIAVTVAMRRGWPFMQPSPKKSPGPMIASTASLPFSEVTVILALPLLQIIDRVGGVALREDDVIGAKLHVRPAGADSGQKFLGIERESFLRCHSFADSC